MLKHVSHSNDDPLTLAALTVHVGVSFRIFILCSHAISRYVPTRTFVRTALLTPFTICIPLQSRTHANSLDLHSSRQGSTSLPADEWIREPLCPSLIMVAGRSRVFARSPHCKWSQAEARLHWQVKFLLNLSSYNFTGNETTEVRAIETLFKYGVGGCGCLGIIGASVC